MLIIILRPIPISYYHITIVSITIISDQLHSIHDFAYNRRMYKSVILKDYVILTNTISIKTGCFLNHVNNSIPEIDPAITKTLLLRGDYQQSRIFIYKRVCHPNHSS